MRRRGFGERDEGSSFGDEDFGEKKSKSILPSSLKHIDMFPKLAQEERERTTEGGAVFTGTLLVIALLVLSEFWTYMTVKAEHHVRVDPTVGQKLRIEFDVEFHALHCGMVSLDAMDVTGEQQEPEEHSIWKQRVKQDGSPIASRFEHLLPWEQEQRDQEVESKTIPEGYCGSCYGAETSTRKCCNTCEDVKSAYIDKGWNAASVSATAEQCKNAPKHESEGLEGEGCRVSGSMLVNKVAGNINVAMGTIHVRETRHIHQFNPADIPKFNVTHTIHKLRFGMEVPGARLWPLEGVTKSPKVGAGVYQYYLKIVPTVWLDESKGAVGRRSSTDRLSVVQQADGTTLLDGEKMRSNQYSVTTFYRPAVVGGIRQNVLPGVFFIYDLSPFMVQVTTRKESLWEFATSVCAIVGGVITVSGLVDGAVYQIRNLWQGVRAGMQ
jgi:endoplasmic reticulum-Golgi intermediate compartment protein 3